MTLVNYFDTHDRLVLWSENTRNDRDGLRRILNEVVAPALNERTDGLSLTALFKRGKTSIEAYIREVTDFFEQGHYQAGYVEKLL